MGVFEEVDEGGLIRVTKKMSLVSPVVWQKTVDETRLKFQKHILSSCFGKVFIIEEHIEGAVVLEIYR